MKKLFLIIVLCLMGINAICLPKTQITEKAGNQLFGNVQRVEYKDSYSVYDKDGNIVERKDGSYVTKRVYQSAENFNEGDLEFSVKYTDNQRVECIVKEDLCKTFTFDEKGRVISIEEPGYGQSVSCNYLYKADERLPFKELKTVNWEEGTTEYEYLYKYEVVDSIGNWLKCKADVKETENGTQVSKKTITIERKVLYFTKDATKRAFDFGDFITQLLSLLILLGLVGHMVYEIFFKAKRYKHIPTVEKFMEERLAAGLNQQANDNDNEQALVYLDEALDTWMADEHEPDQVHPTKYKQIKAAEASIAKAVALKPTNTDVVEHMAMLMDVINSNTKRYFDGSKKLIIVCALAAIFFWVVLGAGLAVLIFIGIAFYMLASMTPAFLVDKRAARAAGNIHDGIFAGIIGLVAGAQTIRTTTKWSDGTTTRDDDNSQHYVAWAIAFAVAVAMYIR